MPLDMDNKPLGGDGGRDRKEMLSCGWVSESPLLISHDSVRSRRISNLNLVFEVVMQVAR